MMLIDPTGLHLPDAESDDMSDDESDDMSDDESYHGYDIYDKDL